MSRHTYVYSCVSRTLRGEWRWELTVIGQVVGQRVEVLPQEHLRRLLLVLLLLHPGTARGAHLTHGVRVCCICREDRRHTERREDETRCEEMDGWMDGWMETRKEKADDDIMDLTCYFYQSCANYES